MASLRAVEIYHDAQTDGGRKFIAIESVEFGHSQSNSGGQLFGYMRPLAVIVCTRDDIQLLAVDAETTDLDTLRLDIPELDELITAGFEP